MSIASSINRGILARSIVSGIVKGSSPVPSIKWAPTFDGATTYMELDIPLVADEDGSFYLSSKCKPASFSGLDAVLGTSDAYGFVRFGETGVDVSIYDGQVASFDTMVIVVDETYSWLFEYDGVTNVGKLTLTDSLGVVQEESVNVGTGTLKAIWVIGRKRTAGYFSGLIYDVDLNGVTYSLDAAFSEYPVFDGVTAYNFTEDDIVEIT